MDDFYWIMLSLILILLSTFLIFFSIEKSNSKNIEVIKNIDEFNLYRECIKIDEVYYCRKEVVE